MKRSLLVVLGMVVGLVGAAALAAVAPPGPASPPWPAAVLPGALAVGAVALAAPPGRLRAPLAAVAALAAGTVAAAQTQAPALVTAEAQGYLATVAGVAALGAPFVRKCVDFALERRWPVLQAFATGDRPIVLAALVAAGWVAFWFQPRLLNVSALDLLPAWQSYTLAVAGITLYAAGTVDTEARRSRARAAGG